MSPVTGGRALPAQGPLPVMGAHPEPSLCLPQHYLHELVIKTLVQHNLFYTLHQLLQYHVLSDSKPLVGAARVTRSSTAPSTLC